jgi:hypothetical protein
MNLIIATTKSGKIALFFAISQGHLKVVEILLKLDSSQVKHVDLGLSVL